MDLDEQAVKIVAEAEALSETDLRGALAKMREALAIEPDYPDLEDEIFIREDAITKLDGVLEFIVVLLQKGKAYQACEMLEGLPENYIIKDKTGLVGGLVEKITSAKDLVEQAQELSQSDLAKSLPIFEEAFKLVPDYPGLVEKIGSLNQDSSRYNSFISDIEKTIDKKDYKNASGLFTNFLKHYPEDEVSGRLNADIINLGKELAKKKEKKINFIKIIAAVGSIVSIVGGYFAYEMILFKKAGHQWEEVNILLEAKKFTETKAASLELKQDLGNVRLFFLASKQELESKVDDLLKSEMVVMGAEGKVLFNGRYIPKDQLNSSKGFNEMIEEAKGLAAAGNYQKAIIKFEEALKVAAVMDSKTSAAKVDDIKLSITGCRLNIIKGHVAKAEKLLANGSFDVAQANITEAIAMVMENSIADTEPLYVKSFKLRSDINQSKLAYLLDRADKYFTTNSLDKAIDSYNKAKTFARANELESNDLNQQIEVKISKSKVQILISSGDGYLADGKWQEAGRTYENGIALARKTGLQNFPAVKQAQINLKKAQIMQLVASLSGQNKLARQQLSANKHKKARILLKLAITQAEKSEWHQENEIVAVLNKLKVSLAEVDENLFINDKKKLLRDRYNVILKRDFDLGDDATLLDPVVVLLDSSPEMLKFSVSAMSYSQQGGQRKYSRYEATYVFDRKVKSWVLVQKSAVAQ